MALLCCKYGEKPIPSGVERCDPRSSPLGIREAGSDGPESLTLSRASRSDSEESHQFGMTVVAFELRLFPVSSKETSVHPTSPREPFRGWAFSSLSRRGSAHRDTPDLSNLSVRYRPCKPHAGLRSRKPPNGPLLIDFWVSRLHSDRTSMELSLIHI